MIIFLKSHPATQALSRAATPADLNEGDIRRNPGEPDAEQAEADAYNKPRIKWQGLTIAVENPAGSVRRGRNRHGVTWEVRMRFDYGEILGSVGVDGDPVDVIVGPNLDAPDVYVVHQRRVNDWDSYDEDKCCVGFDSQADAEQAFLSNYNDPRFLGPVTAMPVSEFVTKVRATKDKPAMIKALLLKTHVAGYTKQDGTFVPPHEDKRQSLQDDLQRQEKWLTAQAVALGYSDIEDMLEKDYPAFERLALQWRQQNPVEVAMKSMVLFFKSYVGAYVRGGRMVQGYQGRAARAVATPGQRSLFDADEHGEVPPARSAYREPQHTDPTKDLVAEHERLVDVLRSPSHADDTVEAKKQASELADMKQETAATKPGVTDRAGDMARRLRDAVDKAAPADRRAAMYASEAQRVRASAAKMAGTPDVSRQYSEAADILDGWAKTAASSTPATDKKILFVKPQTSSNLSNNEPVVNKQELKMDAANMTNGNVSYTFPKDCPLKELRGVEVTGGTFKKVMMSGKPVLIVDFKTKVDGKPVAAKVVGKPELEAAYKAHKAKEAADVKAAVDARNEYLKNTLEGQREALVIAEYNSYSENNIPGSSAWFKNKKAADALRAFDAAHPEIAAAVNEAIKQKQQREWDATSDFVKMGS